MAKPAPIRVKRLSLAEKRRIVADRGPDETTLAFCKRYPISPYVYAKVLADVKKAEGTTEPETAAPARGRRARAAAPDAVSVESLQRQVAFWRARAISAMDAEAAK